MFTWASTQVVAEFEEQAQARLVNVTEYGLRCRQSLNRFAERENFIPPTEERVWNSPQTNCASSEYPTEPVNERKLVTGSPAGGKKTSREIRRWYGNRSYSAGEGPDESSPKDEGGSLNPCTVGFRADDEAGFECSFS